VFQSGSALPLQFPEIFLWGVKPNQSPGFLAIGGKYNGGGGAGDLELPHHVHMAPTFQPNRKKTVVQRFHYRWILVGLESQAQTMGTALQINFQEERPPGPAGFFLGFRQVTAPIDEF